MKWLYHIPHVWDAPTDRHVWEDVYLLPESAPDGMPSLWVTVDALGDPTVPEHGSDRAEFCAESLVTLGDNDWHINETNMLVRPIDFNLAELLDWVRIWLRETGFDCTDLIATPIEMFANTNDHASLVSALKSNMNENGDR